MAIFRHDENIGFFGGWRGKRMGALLMLLPGLAMRGRRGCRGKWFRRGRRQLHRGDSPRPEERGMRSTTADWPGLRSASSTRPSPTLMRRFSSIRRTRTCSTPADPRAHKGEDDKAIADFTEAIRLDPKNPLAFYNRGLLSGRQGQHDKAIADFTEVIRLDPKNAGAFHNRGLAWDHVGQLDKAIADSSEAIRLDPKNPDAFYNWRSRGARRATRARRCPTSLKRFALTRRMPAHYNRGLVWGEKRPPRQSDRGSHRGHPVGQQERRRLRCPRHGP